MAIRFYDEAVVKKISNILLVDKRKLHVLKPNEVNRLWKITVDESNDEPIEMPLIGISRDPSISLSVNHRRPLSCDGVTLVSDAGTVIQMDVIPFDVTYQIDIYTEEFEAGDNYVRELIFNLINYPKMLVEIPYNGANIKHTCYLEVDPSITDNSDIPEKKFPDQFTRWTIRCHLTNAYYFSLPAVTSAQITGVVLTTKGLNKEENSEIVEIDSTKKD